MDRYLLFFQNLQKYARATFEIRSKLAQNFVPFPRILSKFGALQKYADILSFLKILFIDLSENLLIVLGKILPKKFLGFDHKFGRISLNILRNVSEILPKCVKTFEIIPKFSKFIFKNFFQKCGKFQCSFLWNFPISEPKNSSLKCPKSKKHKSEIMALSGTVKRLLHLKVDYIAISLFDCQ